MHIHREQIEFRKRLLIISLEREKHMHLFQKVDFDQLDINPFEMIGKNWMLVTAGNEEKVNISYHSEIFKDVK